MKTSLLLILALLAWAPFAFGKGDLDARSVTVNDTNPDPGDLVTVRWTAINRTGDYIGSSKQGVMFSSNSTISSGDNRIGTEGLGPLGGIYADSSPETKVVRIPTSAVRGRTYWIGVYADIDNDRSESNESNNASGGVAITIRAGDLYATSLSINDSNPDLGDLVTVEWTANARNDIPVGSSSQGVMLSTDSNISTNDTFLESEFLGPLGGAAFQTTQELHTITIPKTLIPGVTYYLGVYMDYGNAVTESNEGNNGASAGSFVPRGPDLRATDLEANTQAFTSKSTTIQAYPNENINLEWIARNTGDGASALFDNSQQAVWWSTDTNFDDFDDALELEPLGILFAGQTSPELRTVRVPADVEIGETYYIAVEADALEEFNEHNEGNNYSNHITVEIISPMERCEPNVSDFNHLPDLEGAGLEFDDPRMKDNTGDGDPDAGVTMNPSRCFNVGDAAYVNLDAEVASAYATIFNATEDISFTARWNTAPSLAGANLIDQMVLAVGSLGGKQLNIEWDIPDIPGDYYVHTKVEIKIDGAWYLLKEGWIDDGAPIVVNNARPVVLVHGWSDDKGKTFGNLEMMIETMWQRPVRFFGYETDNTVDTLLGTGTGNGPRVDEAYNEFGLDGEKESLAIQLETFLKDPEGPGDPSAIDSCDIIAHSMGGLVARNYIRRGITGEADPHKVRRLVTMGTPSYGGLFADTVVGGALLNNQAEDLEYGAEVTWKLHRDWSNPAYRDSLPKCLTIVGTNDIALGPYNQGDVVVTCSSGSLENLGFPVYYVPLGHSGAFSPIGVDGLAVINDDTHESWAPLEAFLTSADASVPANLPGHFGNADDVGDSGHPEALPNGALYIVKTDGSGEAQTLTSVSMGHTESTLLLNRSAINPTGIYYANFVDANNGTLGDRHFTDADSDASTSGDTFQDMPIRVYAGETTVHVINAAGDVHASGDSDGDTLPDAVEDLIIADNPTDGITNFTHVGPNDNYDGDELLEIHEAAFGTDPTERDFGVVRIFTDGGDSVVRHPVADLAALNLEVACEYSPLLDPLTWTEDGIPTFTPDNHMEWRLPLVPDPRAFRILVRPAQE